jgi:integrase
MSAPHFTPSKKLDKPAKPREDFPLFPHANGTWAKKIRGKLHYFGPWADPDGAIEKYNKDKDDLHAGRKPRDRVSAGVTVEDVCDAFMAHKEGLVDAGELSIRTLAKYLEVGEVIIRQLGKTRLASDLRSDDFAAIRNTMAKKWGPLRVGDFIQHIRSVFKYAYESEMIDRPVRFGPGFERPSQQVIRRHKATQGKKLFTAEELARLVAAAGVQMKAIILLGVNCGFGNADCGTVPLSVLNLDAGRVDYPRPKTGVERRCWLWPETVDAIRVALAQRPAPKSEAFATLAFLSQRGTPLVSVRDKDRTDGIAVQFGLLLERVGLKRPGLSFYALRHTHRTIADETHDQAACDRIMGHSDDGMAAHYRERIGDERLRAVADHVRAWFIAGVKATEQKAKAEAPDVAPVTESK